MSWTDSSSSTYGVTDESSSESEATSPKADHNSWEIRGWAARQSRENETKLDLTPKQKRELVQHKDARGKRHGEHQQQVQRREELHCRESHEACMAELRGSGLRSRLAEPATDLSLCRDRNVLLVTSPVHGCLLCVSR